jgi:hypothetical protein
MVTLRRPRGLRCDGNLGLLMLLDGSERGAGRLEVPQFDRVVVAGVRLADIGRAHHPRGRPGTVSVALVFAPEQRARVEVLVDLARRPDQLESTGLPGRQGRQ